MCRTRDPGRLQRTDSDSRPKNFVNIFVERDAISPNRLREFVETAIPWHLPPQQFEIPKVVEENERARIAGLVGMTGQAGQ